MKNLNSLSKSGPAAAVLVAGVLVLATGCVEDHVTYVRPAYPAPVEAPEPLPPPDMAPPPPAVYVPPAPPPTPVVQLRSTVELDTMLAPIALYPDPLLAQLLPAATLPEQVVLADRYVREGADMYQVDAQPWANSLKALARYPATLRMLDDNLAWTTDLGLAFLNQPADVMDSVQRLRARALAVGNLRSTPQQSVVVNGGIIEILPAMPQVIYVPVYQPEVVYVQPPPAPDRFYVSFGPGLVVGAWLNHDCDWHNHEVIVWRHDHPRPPDWWQRPPERRETTTVVNNVTVVNNTTINNTTVVNQNYTVWRPRDHSAVANRGDRGWGAQAVRATAPATEQRRQPEAAVAQNPVPSREVRPAPPAREIRPNQPEVQRPPTGLQEARRNPPREDVKAAPVIPSREIHASPPAQQAPPTALPPRAPSITLPATGNQVARGNLPREEVKPAPRPNPPVVAPKDVRPAPAPPANSRSVASVPGRTPTTALTGIENPRGTREASARGQQSREALTRPAAPPRRAPAPASSPKANPEEKKKPHKGQEN